MSRQNFHLIILPLSNYNYASLFGCDLLNHTRSLTLRFTYEASHSTQSKKDLSQWGVATFCSHRSIGSIRFICRNISRSLIRSWRITQTAISERLLPWSYLVFKVHYFYLYHFSLWLRWKGFLFIFNGGERRCLFGSCKVNQYTM